MKRYPCLYTLALCLVVMLIYGLPADAQAPGDAQTSRAAGETRNNAVADSNAAMRRQMAVSLITSLADEARNFRDNALRARVQARAADALWQTDKVAARDLFRRAWEAATAFDAKASERYQNGLREAKT